MAIPNDQYNQPNQGSVLDSRYTNFPDELWQYLNPGSNNIPVQFNPNDMYGGWGSQYQMPTTTMNIPRNMIVTPQNDYRYQKTGTDVYNQNVDWTNQLMQMLTGGGGGGSGQSGIANLLGLPTELPAVASMQDMASTYMDYPSMDWGFDSTAFSPTPASTGSPTAIPTVSGQSQNAAGVPGYASYFGTGGAGGQSPNSMQVNSGITAPNLPSFPSLGAMPKVSGMSSMGYQGAAPNAYGQAQQQSLADQGSWYKQSANMGNQFQQAQSDAGQGWSKLMNYIQNLTATDSQNQQNSWLKFLSSLGTV